MDVIVNMMLMNVISAFLGWMTLTIKNDLVPGATMAQQWRAAAL